MAHLSSAFLVFLIFLLHTIQPKHNENKTNDLSVSFRLQIGSGLKLTQFLTRNNKNNSKPEHFKRKTFAILFILLCGDIETNPGPNELKTQFSKACTQYIKYRLNAKFISTCLLHNIIPKGFQQKNGCAVTNDSNIRQLWQSHLNTNSFNLMKLTCAFYASKLPSIHERINNMFDEELYRKLYSDLQKTHDKICKIHTKKLYCLGIFYRPPLFMPP